MYSRIAGTGLAWALFGSDSRAARRQPSPIVIQTGSTISIASGSGSTMRGAGLMRHSPAPCGRVLGAGSRAGRRERLLGLGRRFDSPTRCRAPTPPPHPRPQGAGEWTELSPTIVSPSAEMKGKGSASQMIPRDLVLRGAAEEAGAVGVGVDIGLQVEMLLVAGHDDAGVEPSVPVGAVEGVRHGHGD